MEFGEDVVQLLPIFERVKRVVVCDQPLYHYRFRNSSITKTFQLKRQTDLIAFMEERKRYAIRYGLSQEFMLTEFYPYLYCYFIKTFYPIGECKQYSNEELIGHFRKMWKTELIQKMLEVTLPPQMTTVDKMIALLYKNERFSLLLAFLRLEKRVVARLGESTWAGVGTRKIDEYLAKMKLTVVSDAIEVKQNRMADIDETLDAIAADLVAAM